ncbi:MAG: phosphoglycerate dehydrogenase [Acidobacteriota bacterium]|nr:phosphoglycerate dehydrogenase [Acidobacteriota bacterium]
MTTPLDKTKTKIVLLESIHEGAAEAFRAGGYTNVEQHAGALSDDRLRQVLADAHLVGIRSRTRLTRALLEAAPSLVAVGCFCIGTDQVDLEAAQDLGVPVFNAPFSNTRSVAELVLAETVLLLRGIPERNALAHRGVWRKSAEGAHEARGKVLGIVGYGHIGTQVGLLAESLGMQVVFHDIRTKLALGNARPTRSLDELLESADVVTLHVPDTPETRAMIGAGAIARMRRGAALINASRGTVVDVEALAAALESGHLSGAAIDVFPAEPQSSREAFESPLRRFDQVLLTPHVGGSTEEAQQNIAIEVAEKLIRYSDNGSTLSSVNFPEVALPEHAGKHRVLHIHRNQAGMLARINDVFSRRGINVSAQYLQTSPRIGYVVIDVELDDRIDMDLILRELSAINGTIRTRVLH